MLKKGFVLGFFIFFAIALSASNFIFRHLSTDNGLKCTQVHALLEDNRGFLWIGTTDGLNRFDGLHFKQYVPNKDNSLSIQQNNISYLFQDKKGLIWIFFSSGEISFYNPLKDTFTNFTAQQLKVILPDYSNPSKIIADSLNNIFIGTNAGLLIYNSETKRLYTIKSNQKDLISASVKDLVLDINNNVWIATAIGVVKYIHKQKKYRIYGTKKYYPSSVFIDSDNNLWVGTNNDGLLVSHISDDNAGKFKLVKTLGKNIYQILEGDKNHIWVSSNKGITLFEKRNTNFEATKNFFSSKHYFYNPTDFFKIEMLKDNSGNIWFGDLKIEEGLFYFSKQKNKLDSIVVDVQNQYALQQYGITTMYIDKSNNLWIGHNNAGLSVTGLNKNPFKLKVIKTQSNELSSNHIYSLCEDHNQNLWVGTDKGIDVFDRSAEKSIAHYKYKSTIAGKGLSGRVPGSITEDKNHNIWVGYLGANPDLIDVKNNIVYNFNYKENERNSAFIWRTMKIVIDKNNTPWFTTSNAGLASYNYDTKQFQYYAPGKIANTNIAIEKNVKGKISDYSLYSICIDKEGFLWIGTDFGGLNRFDPTRKNFVNYLHSETNSSTIASNFVRYVYCDASNNIWVGTNSGLDFFNRKRETFEHYNVDNGLVGNTIQGIVEGERNIIYISTNSGISRFDITNKKITNFSAKNGLFSDEYSTGACLRRKSGELVFGSVNKGVLSFFPEQLRTIVSQPDVHFVSFKVKNKEINPITGKHDQNQILYSDEVKLDYNQSKDITIGFQSIDFIFPERLQYKYRLVGFDGDWKYVDFTNSVANFSQLSPGKYVLEVTASTDSENWGQLAKLKITIRSPWWQSWWFLVLLASVIGYLAYFIYKKRIATLTKRQQILERQIEDRTQKLQLAKTTVEAKNIELEMFNQRLEQQNAEIVDISEQLKKQIELKTKFFTNISHEFRTPLSIIKGMFESLTGRMNPKELNKYLEHVSVIEKNILLLIKHVNQLLNISMIDKEAIIPKISENNLNLLLTETSSNFGKVCEQYQVNFSYFLSENIKSGFYDADIVEQCLFNLLSNALKYTPNDGKITLSAFTSEVDKETWVNIFIEDNGIGIRDEDKSKIFDRFFRNQDAEIQRFESSGIGLAYSKEIIITHLGDITFTSEFKKGSTFKLCFPISKKAYPKEWLNNKVQLMNDKLFKEIELIERKKAGLPKVVIDVDLPVLLIAEDNIELCSYLKELLQDTYKIIIANDGKSALHMSEEYLPDLILSDVMMPLMSGLELCRHIKSNELTAHIPVILLTAMSTEQQQLDGYETGADDYILKPFNSNILLAVLKRHMEQNRKIKSHILNSMDIDNIGADLPDDDRIFLEKATKVVLDNLQNTEFDVDLFCSYMFMSRTNLFRKLKATTGQSATAFTKTIRLKQAAFLLKNSSYTINEISTLVGFADPNYFSRCFKEMYNVTPSNY